MTKKYIFLAVGEVLGKTPEVRPMDGVFLFGILVVGWIVGSSDFGGDAF